MVKSLLLTVLIFILLVNVVFGEGIINVYASELVQENVSVLKQNSALFFDETARLQRIDHVYRYGKPITTSGFVEVIFYDDFENERSKTEYYLRINDDTRYRLYFTDEPYIDSEDFVVVEGIILENEIVTVEHFKSEEPIQKKINPSIGNQETIVLLVNFIDDRTTPLTTEQVRNKVFDEHNFYSLNSYIKETSYNKSWVTGDVFGWYELPFVKDTYCGGDFYTARDTAIKIADNDVDYRNYKHLMIIFPSHASCSASAAGPQRIITDDGIVYLSNSILNGVSSLDNNLTTLHEFGHQLGLKHANGWECENSTIGPNCSSINYRDWFDVMGRGKASHFNAFHKEKLGWFNTLDILTLQKSGIYFIKPIETSERGVKMIKIPTIHGFFYSVEYKRPVLHDAIFSQQYGAYLYDGAIVHTNVSNINLGYDTQLLDMTPTDTTLQDFLDSALTNGKTFIDRENNISIKVLEVNDQYLKVCIGHATFCTRR